MRHLRLQQRCWRARDGNKMVQVSDRETGGEERSEGGGGGGG